MDSELSQSQQTQQTQSIGHWLPRDRPIIQQWLRSKLKEVKGAPDTDLNPPLRAFRDTVKASSYLTDLANSMFTEASKKYPEDPTGKSAIKSFEEMLTVMNLIMTQGPQFYDKADPPTAMGLIGFPINAILDWPMGTPSGYVFFLSSTVNSALKAVLDAWGTFLKDPASKACLDGWLSRDGQTILAAKANDGMTDYSFLQIYEVPNSNAPPLYGFQSWDQFFTRRFNDRMRPVEAPDDGPFDPKYPDPTAIIINACESAPLKLNENVQLFDTFWLKGQPYSLINMLNNSVPAYQFIGGTVYQAFLSALSYHRWHAPVSGTVQKIDYVAGTYYSENQYEGLGGNPTAPDPGAPNYSQPYISSVATRAIIYIEADNPNIGLMAIVFIGMAEVSSCEFTVAENQPIKKGQEIGMFHFGGSSHCMVFRPGVDLQFLPPRPWEMDTEPNLMVNSALAVACAGKL